MGQDRVRISTRFIVLLAVLLTKYYEKINIVQEVFNKELDTFFFFVFANFFLKVLFNYNICMIIITNFMQSGHQKNIFRLNFNNKTGIMTQMY